MYFGIFLLFFNVVALYRFCYTFFMARGLIGSAIVGIILGFVASKMLFLQWATLLPWGVAGLIIGLFGKTKKEAALLGAVYGFCLGFVFMLSGYQGKDPVITKVPPFIILGIVSSVFGSILSLLASLFKKGKAGSA